MTFGAPNIRHSYLEGTHHKSREKEDNLGLVLWESRTRRGYRPNDEKKRDPASSAKGRKKKAELMCVTSKWESRRGESE